MKISIRGEGYKMTSNGKYEHRILMEKNIDRQLKSTEIVHHRNNNRLDNRIENLFLFEDKSMHNRYHWFIRKNGYISEESFMLMQEVN